MTTWVALLRAVNVGGTGKLPMVQLVALCQQAGFDDVRTYIASGNALFRSRLGENAVQAALADRLAVWAGRPVGVLVRSAQEMADVLAGNPFAEAPGNRTVVIFLPAAPAVDLLQGLRGQQDERVAPGRREVYVAYGSGMAKSKLVVPGAAEGTARNMNTVARLAQLATG